MGSHLREITAALNRLRSGRTSLTPEQYVALLNAVEDAAIALQTAPRGHDPVATGVWYNHDRSPALARLVDALRPEHRHAAADRLRTDRHSDLSAIRALRESLGDSRV